MKVKEKINKFDKAVSSLVTYTAIILVSALVALAPVCLLSICGNPSSHASLSQLVVVSLVFFSIQGLLMTILRRPFWVGVGIAAVWTVFYTYLLFFPQKNGTGIVDWMGGIAGICLPTLFEGWLLQFMGDYLQLPWICRKTRQPAAEH